MPFGLPTRLGRLAGLSELWTNTGVGWKLLSAVGFDDEATLHSLVEEAPELLPLSGSPEIAIVGREVTVGGGSIDLVAVEASGRPVIIEDGPLCEGDREGFEVECPRHGARFDVRTGRVLSLPATEDVDAFPVTVRDGEVFVEV